MKTVFFLLLRLICYPALAIVVGWWLSLVPRPKMGGWLILAGAAWVLVLAGVFLLANPLLMQLRGETRKEFAPGADQAPAIDPLSRRNFFHLMGASMGLAARRAPD